MGLKELREKLALIKTEVRGLIGTDVAAAEIKMTEVRSIEKQIAILEELAAEEERALLAQAIPGKKIEEANEFRSIVKQVMGAEMTVEERASINTTDNAAVVPKQLVNQIIELQKGFGSLKGLCDIISVTKNEGTIPVVDLDQNELLDVLEGADIVDGTLVTTDIPFKCVKVGLIQSLTSELVSEAEVEIEGLVKKNFVNIATAKENFKILKVIKDNAGSIIAGTTYEDVAKLIDASLPSVKAGLSTLTNVSGYVLLKNIKDLNGVPLNLITNVNGVDYFNGKPLYYVEDASLPATALKTVFYVLNFKEVVKYIDRQAITIVRSTEAGFRDDTVKIRILERFIPVKGSIRSLKKMEI